MVEKAKQLKPIARISDVSFRYGNDITALENFSLTIHKGSSIALVGPSGCGKSTLLSILSGLRAPTTGRVDWTRGPDESQHRLTMLFQQNTLLPWATVEENVGLFFRFKRGFGLGRKDRRATRDRVRELITMAGLEGFEQAYPYQLSGGMRRRVNFLSAIAPLPETLLLDEPFVSLDEPTRLSLHELVWSMTRQLGITLVLVTHDLAESLILCDEILVLSRRPGRVVESFDVPFGNDRDIVHLRSMPEFLSLYGQIWDVLSEQISGQDASRPEAERDQDFSPVREQIQ